MERPHIAAHEQVLLGPGRAPGGPDHHTETLSTRIEKPCLRPIAGEILKQAPYRERRALELIVREHGRTEMAGIVVQSDLWIFARPDVLQLGRQCKIASRIAV